MYFSKATLLFLLLFSFMIPAQGQKNYPIVAPKKVKTPKLRILITRPGETSLKNNVKNSWFSALIESYYYFRFHPLKTCNIIPRKKFTKALHVSDDFGLVIPEHALLTAAKELKATHILIHNYDINNKAITYYLEILRTKDKKVIMNFDNSFPLQSIAANLEECSKLILEKIKVTPSKRIAEVLKRPILSTDIKDLKALGYILAESSGEVTEKTVQKLVKIVNRDATFALALFKTALAYKSLGDCDETGRLLNQLILRNGLYYPQLYVETSKNFRICQSYDKAHRVLNLAEKRGWNTREILLERALIFEKIENVSGARQIYDKILKMDPNQPDALLFLARHYRKTGSYQESLKLLDRLLQVTKNPGPVYLEKGENLLAMKKSDEAFRALRSANKLLPDDLKAHLLLGDIYFKKKNYKSAANHYTNILKDKEMQNKLDLLLKASNSYKLANDPKKAIAILNKYKSNFYDTKVVTKEIGLLKFQLKDTTEARKILETCVSIRPPDGSVFLALGDIYSSDGEHGRAISMYERAKPLVKDKNSIKIALANLYILKKEYKKAEKSIRSIISTKPHYPRANLLLADIMRNKGSNKDALTFYKTERQFHGDNIYILQNIAQLCFELNDMAMAQKESEKLIKLDPTNAMGYFQLAVIAVNQKKVSQAKRYLTQGEATGKANKVVYRELGKGFAAVGSMDMAIDAYNKSLKLDPNNEKTLMELGKVYERAKKETDAIRVYLKLYKLNQTKNSSYLAKAGHTLYKLGMVKKAYGIYEKFYQKGYKDPLVNVNFAAMEFEAKKYQKIISLLKNLTGKYASDTRVVKMLLYSYINTGKQTAALPYIKKLLTKTPNDKDIIEMAALAYEKKGNLKSASAMYKKFLTFKKTKKHQKYAYHLAKLYEKQKLISLAIKQYKSNIAFYPNDFRNYKNLVLLYINSKNYTKAVSVLSKASSKPSAPSSIHKKLAEIYTIQKKKSLAASAYEKYLKEASTDSTALYELGSIYYAQKSYKKAIKPLEMAATLMPKNRSCLNKLAISYFRSGDLSKAITIYVKILKLDPNNEDVLIELAKLYVRAKKESNAARVYLKLYQLNQVKNSSYLAKAGHTFYKLGMKKEAYDAYNTFLQKKHKDPLVNVNTAAMEFKAKKYLKTISLLKNLTGKYASDTRVVKMLLYSYINTGKQTAALPYIKKLLIKKPNDKGIIEMAAIAYEKNGNLKSASAMYKKFLTFKKTKKHQKYAYHLATLYEKQKATSMAIAQYKRNTVAYPNDFLNYKRLAQLYIRSRNYTKAVSVLSKASSKPSAPSSIHKKLAEIYTLQKKKSLAATAYERYLKKAPTDSTAWYELGSIYYAQKSYKKAIKPLEMAADLMPRKSSCLFELAFSYFKAGHVPKAVSTLKKALTLKSNDRGVLLLLTKCLETMKDTTELIAVLQKRTVLEPKSFKLNYQLGNLLFATGQNDLAIRAMEAASKAKPANINTHMKLITLYEKTNNSTQRISHINTVLRYAPKNADIHFEKALYHIKNNELDKAKTSLEKAIKLKPKHVRARFYYGKLYKKEKNFKTAFYHFNQAVKYAPKNPDYLLNLAQMAQLIGKKSLAITTINKAFNIAPDNAKIMQWAGYIYFKAGKEKKAEQFLLKGLRANDNCPFCHEQLGSIYSARAEYSKAIPYLEKGVQKNNRNEPLILLLANALSFENQPRRAINYYKKAFEINPKNDETLYRLCVLYVNLGMIKNAENVITYNKGRKKTVWGHLAQARVQEATGNNAVAIVLYKTALLSMPNSHDANMGLGRIYLAQKQYNDALKRFSKAMVEKPEDIDIFVGMGKSYYYLNNYQAALELFSDVAKKQPDQPDTYYMMGLIYSKMRKHNTAITILKRGLNRYGKNADIHFALGIAYENILQFKGAIDSYRNAVKYDATKAVEAYLHIGDIYYDILKNNRKAKKYYGDYIKAGGTSNKVKMIFDSL